MRTALLTTAVATTAGAVLLGLAAPAGAATDSTTVTSFSSAFASFVTGEDAVYVDGYDHGRSAVGVPEVFFGDGTECFSSEGSEPSTLFFDRQGIRRAVMAGTTRLVCVDPATGTEHVADVTVDLTWTATAYPKVNRFSSPQLGCTSVRHTSPAVVRGSVQVVVPGRGIDRRFVPSPERPAEVARQVDRCTTGQAG